MSALPVAATARARVDRIKTGVEVIWQLIVESYQERDWEALGYATWDEMCTREFGTSRLRLPREERAETVQSLRDAGLSLRAIEAATGVSRPTIIKDLAAPQVVNPLPPATPQRVERETGEVLDEDAEWGASIEAEVEASESVYVTPPPIAPAPEPVDVTGIDGKRYTITPRKQPRKALVEIAKSRGFAIRQATDAVLKVFEDDRHHANEKQVADALRGHLLYVAETVAAVLDQLS